MSPKPNALATATIVLQAAKKLKIPPRKPWE